MQDVRLHWALGLGLALMLLLGINLEQFNTLDQTVFDLFRTQVTTPLRPVTPERPTVNVPMGDREANWGGGSCVHASVVMLFRWQGRLKMAQHWRATYIGGETASGLHAKMDKEGVRYAYTTQADVKFLEWALRTHRGAAVTCMGGVHMVCLVYLDEKQAWILDNNAIGQIQWMPRERFLAEWRASDGWATAVLYTPSAPLPQ